MKNLEIVRIKDALYNLSPGSGSSNDYNRGIVVGIVSALLSAGFSFDDAKKVVFNSLPKDYDEKAIPDYWLD